MKNIINIALFLGLFLTAVSCVQAPGKASFRWPSQTQSPFIKDNPAPVQKVINAPIQLNAECIAFINSLPPTYNFGWAEASEIANDEKSSKVYTFYYHRPNPKFFPTVFFNGGPFMSGHGTHYFLDGWSDAEPEHYGSWMIYLDQRGTGCSSPIPLLIKDEKHRNEFMHWGSIGVVRDAEAVRKLIGFDRWNIYGQSFGSMIVLRYITMFPESIATALGHGGVILNQGLDALQLRMDQQLFVVQKYLEVFPGDRDLVKKIVTKRLCYPDQFLCGGDAIKSLAIKYMGMLVDWPELHKKIELAAQSVISKPHRSARPPSEEKPISEELRAQYIYRIKAQEALAYWIGLTEMGGITDWNRCNSTRRKALQILGKDAELFAFSECWGHNGQQGFPSSAKSGLDKFLRENHIPTGVAATVRANLEKYPHINYHLFSSEFDYYTPPALVSRMAAELGPRANYLKIRGQGHEAYHDPRVVRYLFPYVDEYMKANGM